MYQSLLDTAGISQQLLPSKLLPSSPEFNPESRPRTTFTKHTRTHTL